MAEESSSSSTKIVLRTSDNVFFEMEKKVAMQSRALKHIMDDCPNAIVIPLPNVVGKVMAKVVEYCNKHAETVDSDDQSADIKKFDRKFVDVDQNTLFDLVLAAHYLVIDAMLDLTCEAVANIMMGKTPEEIRKIFHIKNDFTPEEEEAIRKEYAWAFE